MNANNARKLAGKESVNDNVMHEIFDKVRQAAEKKQLSCSFEFRDYRTLCEVVHSLRTLQYQVVQNDDSLVISIHW